MSALPWRRAAAAGAAQPPPTAAAAAAPAGPPKPSTPWRSSPPPTVVPPPSPPPGGSTPPRRGSEERNPAAERGNGLNAYARTFVPSAPPPATGKVVAAQSPPPTAVRPPPPPAADPPARAMPSAAACVPALRRPPTATGHIGAAAPPTVPPPASPPPTVPQPVASFGHFTPPRSGHSPRMPQQMGGHQALHGEPQFEEKVTITTPWYPEGVEKGSVRLGDEVARLALLLGLAPQEHRQRQRLVDVIAEQARQQWGDTVRVLPYGSYATGTAVHSSALDVCVERCGALAAEDVCAVAGRAGQVRSMLCDGGSAFAQVECRESGVVANINFAAEAGSPAARTVAVLREWLAEFPAAAAAHAVLRQVLLQTGNLDVANGGLSAHCLLTMLIACCRRNAARGGAADSAQLLIDFCTAYGQEWDYAADSVDAAAGAPPPVRLHAEETISVIDPANPANNLAAGCTRLFAIRAQLQHCCAALMRWGEVAGRRGYKGKTPLSSILSHQRLAARAEQVRRMKEAGGDEGRAVYGVGHLYALRCRAPPPPAHVRALDCAAGAADAPPAPDAGLAALLRGTPVPSSEENSPSSSPGRARRAHPAPSSSGASPSPVESVGHDSPNTLRPADPAATNEVELAESDIDDEAPPLLGSFSSAPLGSFASASRVEVEVGTRA